MNPQTISSRSARPEEMGTTQSDAEMPPLTNNDHAEAEFFGWRLWGWLREGRALHALMN
jgi:hypothetical protein